MDVESIVERQTVVSELLRPELNSDADALRAQLKGGVSKDLHTMLAMLGRYWRLVQMVYGFRRVYVSIRLSFRVKFPDDPLQPLPTAPSDPDDAQSSTLTPATALRALKSLSNAVATIRSGLEAISSDACQQLLASCRSSLLQRALRPERTKPGTPPRPSYEYVEKCLEEFESVMLR